MCLNKAEEKLRAECGEALDQGADAKGSLRESFKKYCGLHDMCLISDCTSHFCHQDITRLTSHFTHQIALIQSDALPQHQKRNNQKNQLASLYLILPKRERRLSPKRYKTIKYQQRSYLGHRCCCTAVVIACLLQATFPLFILNCSYILLISSQ